MKITDYTLKDDIEHLTDDTFYKKVGEKMRNCSVTIVLIGEGTDHRKWIDWEIWASLRGYTYYRLQDNIDSSYAVSMKGEIWTGILKAS